MKCFFSLPLKQGLFWSLLLPCLLIGCASQDNVTSSVQGMQDTPTQGVQSSCPAQGIAKGMRTSRVAYAVSWDAVATDADNN